MALANAALDSKQVSQTTVTWVKRSRYNPLRTLTPDYLSRIIDTWNNGYLREFALMADAIKQRDPIINIALRKREKGVARHGFQVLLADGLEGATKARGEEHQAALKWFFDHLRVTHVLEQDVSGGFRLLVEQMMSAMGARYAVHEIVWRPSIDPITNQPRLAADFNYVPPWFFEATTGRLRFIQAYFGTSMGEDMAEDAWLVTVGEGLLETLSAYFVIKHAALEAWAGYSERFGTPGVHGKTSAAKDSPAWAEFAAAVATFGSEWATVTSQDATIELIEAKASGDMPFEKLIERIDRAIVTLIRGGDLSTLSSGAHGSGGQGRGSSLQGDETALLEQDDAEFISESLQKISKIVVKQLFGEDEPLAKVCVVVPEQKNNTDTIAKVAFAVNSGVPVGMEYVRGELGIPPPMDGEPVLKPAPGPAGPNAQQQDQRALANAALHEAVNRTVFDHRAASDITSAQQAALQPLLDRVLALRDAPDLGAALRALYADAPALLLAARSDAPEVDEVWDQVFATALATGLADRPAATS